MGYNMEETRVKLLENCNIDKETGCWNWYKAIDPVGYAVMAVKDEETGIFKTFRAHRLAYELFKEDIPADLLVRHTCNNRVCVNPDHLEIGTQSDNSADISKKISTAHSQYEYDLKDIMSILDIRTKTRAHRVLVSLVKKYISEDEMILYYFKNRHIL